MSKQKQDNSFFELSLESMLDECEQKDYNIDQAYESIKSQIDTCMDMWKINNSDEVHGTFQNLIMLFGANKQCENDVPKLNEELAEINKIKKLKPGRIARKLSIETKLDECRRLKDICVSHYPKVYAQVYRKYRSYQELYEFKSMCKKECVSFREKYKDDPKFGLYINDIDDLQHTMLSKCSSSRLIINDVNFMNPSIGPILESVKNFSNFHTIKSITYMSEDGTSDLAHAIPKFSVLKRTNPRYIKMINEMPTIEDEINKFKKGLKICF